MKDYIRKEILSDVLKPGDFMKGKTGFNHLDNLTDQEREEMRKTYLAELEKMTPQEKAQVVDFLQAEIRKKRRENNGRLMNSSSYDVLREMMNVDLPKATEEAAAEAEQYGYLELAQHLRRRGNKISTENIKINIVNDKGDVVDQMIL